MAAPLELSYNWRAPALVATVAVLLCVSALVRSRVEGWLPAVLLVLGVWVLFEGVVYLRTRAYLKIDGPTVTVRRYRGFHTIRAEELTGVIEFPTPHGPCYRLVVADPHGRRHRYVAPAALLRGGHSTLFAWILTHAPHAELDSGSRRTVERLKIRGLLR